MINLEDIDKYIKWRNKWSEQSSMNLSEYISFNINPDDVLIIGKLLFPDVVQVDDCIFLKENYDEDTYQELRMKYNDYQKMEYEINKLYLYELFAHSPINTDEKSFKQVAVFLKFSWKIYLEYIFPERKIIVKHIDEPMEYGNILTFYSVSNCKYQEQ